jgi:uncharacterized protein
MHGANIELRVRGVCIEGPDDSPKIILESPDGCRSLSVAVGPFEASAIIMELEGITPPRPLTHDLLAIFFREAGYSLDRTELFGVDPACPKARLVYRRGFRRLDKEVRPADAIALALRLEAKVLVSPELFRERPSPPRDAGADGAARILFLDDWKRRSLASTSQERDVRAGES